MRQPFLPLLLMTAALTAVFGYNPPAGGESSPALLSPATAGGNSSVTGGAFSPTLPAALAVNPALSAGEQRIIVDASYLSLIGNKNDRGLGHALNLGLLYPTRWAVLGGSIGFLASPFESVPLGTSGTIRFSASKDLTDTLYIGAGIAASTGTGWGAAADIGMLYLLGNAGFMKNARFGVSLTGMGRPFTPRGEGVNGGTAEGFPSMFTLKTGFAATLLDTESFDIGASTDLSLPTFQNLVFDAGLESLIKDIVTVRMGWTFNLVETLNNKQSYLPSVSIGAKLKLNSPGEDSFLARNGWGQSEMTPTVAFRSLSPDVMAIGGGVNVKLGVVDKKPPVIAVQYPEELYFSPNNDGTKDELSFDVSITDQRYVLAWDFIIEDEAGLPVRTIANKEVRTEMADIKSFWKLLTRQKEGIPLPTSLRWDGFLDSGDVAPDGTYKFRVSATDDNSNKGSTELFTVHVDNTAPTITLSPPQGANAMIFSPDGDGNKDTFGIGQTGSIEDLWTASVLNNAGTAVKTVENKNTSPGAFVWDGKTDSSAITADGVYSYTISATDRAGNTVSARVDNIIVDTEKPAINVSIDSNFFSPNGNGVKETVTLTPSIPVQTGLIEWKLNVVSKTGSVSKSFTGTGIARPIQFDGKNDAGALIAEGDYQAVITARYTNGHAPEARSPFFTLDITAPEAQTRSSLNLFSPVGDGKLDTVTFTQQASTEVSWTGEIFALDANGNPAGKSIRTFQYGPTPDASIVWNGRDDSGKLAADGFYGYRLTSTDKAGNTGLSNIAKVEINTEKADLILQANLSAFSPNGDGAKDTIVFTPILKAATAVAKYSLEITNEKGAVVKTFAGTGKVPASISWNGIADPLSGSSTGTQSPDGLYRAALEVTLVNQQTSRSQAPDFTLDTVYPSIETSVPWMVFSPNGDGNRDSLAFTQLSSIEDLWTASIVNSKNAQVKAFRWNGKAENFSWDATDDSGNLLQDGTYAYRITGEDKAGNKAQAEIKGITIDSRTPKAYITAELPAFSPNGDGFRDTQKLSIVTNITDGLASWSVVIKSETGNTAVKEWNSTTQKALPAVINWDGKSNSQELLRGKYAAELTLQYEKGDKVSATTPAFLVNATPPTLNVSLSPRYFSPDNDGIEDELFISLTADSLSTFAEWSFEIREPAGTSGNVFWKTGGTGKITERIIWDGRSLKGELVQAATDYPFTFTVKDDVGMTSVVRGYIPVDVMVIRDGDKLKIAVPSIIFRENAADFNGLAGDVVDKNTQVLKRIAEILNKFKDYKVQVEGHANNVTGTQREEDSELIPLSRQRAEAVKDFLVRNGVDNSRLSTIGMGGTRPVAQRADRENWWKNRRVEFILIK